MIDMHYLLICIFGIVSPIRSLCRTNVNQVDYVEQMQTTPISSLSLFPFFASQNLSRRTSGGSIATEFQVSKEER